MSFLKNHPFAVAAHFECSLVLTYAVAKEELQPLIPECLQLDVHDDKWAFVAVAMVQTRDLRPKGFPAFMGSDFCLTGYRIFVRYTTRDGKRLRGLYILRSETNKGTMSYFGNMLTHYNYRTTDISFREEGGRLSVVSRGSDLEVVVSTGDEPVALPVGSPFADWKEARRFAGPLPFTFTYTRATREVLIIEGVREDWVPKPVKVLSAHAGFLESLGLENVVLANAFVIRDIPYYWKKGRTEIWQP